MQNEVHSQKIRIMNPKIERVQLQCIDMKHCIIELNENIANTRSGSEYMQGL